MPVGTWFGQSGGGSRDREGNYAGSLTGPGPTSQPRASSRLADQANTWGPPISPGYQGGQGSPSAGLNPNIGSWALGAAKTASNQLAQQAVGPQPSASSLNPFTGARSLLETNAGPQTELIGNMLARQLSGMGEVPVRADYNAGLLTRDTDLARRGFGLDRANVGLDRASLGVDTNLTKGQLANLDRLRGILGKQYGLEGEALTNQLAQLGIDEAKLKDMAKRQTFDLRSNLTARGAFNTVANDRGTGRINRDLIYGLGGINNQRTAADIQHRGNVLGLDEKGIGYDNQGLNLRARLANNGIDSSRLDNTLARIGLSEEQVTNQLTDGLANIGFEGEAAVNGFLDSIQGILVGVDADQRTGILNSLVQLTGIPAEVLSEMLGVPVSGPDLGAYPAAQPARTSSGVPGGTTR